MMAALTPVDWIVLALVGLGTLWGALRALAGPLAVRGWRLGARLLLNLATGAALAGLLFASAEPPASSGGSTGGLGRGRRGIGSKHEIPGSR